MRSGLRPFATLAWAALLLSGCQRTVPVAPEESSVSLIGVVVASADSVFISVGRSERDGRRVPESGARLEVSGPGVRVELVEAPEGGAACGGGVPEFSCYRGRLGGAVGPGDVVRLEGELASGRSIGGEARVPDVPAITVEGAGPGDTIRAGRREDARPRILGLEEEPFQISAADTVARGTVWVGKTARTCPVPILSPSARWDLSRPPSFFEVALAVDEPDCPGAPELAWDSMAVPITFLGYDRNFTEWSRGQFFDGTAAGVGVTGVEGVFGAATPRTFVLIVTP